MAFAKLPRVGVIITSHDCEAYIAEAIESVAAQTIRNLEVAIVDDASQDGTAGVVRDLLAIMRDSRFSFTALDANRGQAGAVRCGLEQLSSPFVCILDGDDVWHESFVERHLAAHLNTEFPVGFSYCDSHFINASGELLAGTAWWFNRSADDPLHRPIDPSTLPTIDPAKGTACYPANPALTLHEEWSPAWSGNSMASMMFRRDLVDLVFPSADDQVRLYLDYYLSTFCMLISGGIAIHEALYAYRMHGKNSHSGGRVVGGTFETSGKDWKAISQRILELVLAEMEARRATLTAAVGEGHFNHSLEQLRAGISRVNRILSQIEERTEEPQKPSWLDGLLHAKR